MRRLLYSLYIQPCIGYWLVLLLCSKAAPAPAPTAVAVAAADTANHIFFFRLYCVAFLLTTGKNIFFWGFFFILFSCITGTQGT